MLNNVSEVMVTEGECGFIVKTRSGLSPELSKMNPLAKDSYKRITSYYQYRRTRR